MRTYPLLAAAALTLGVATGCSTLSGTGTGALAGGLTGAGVGRIAGDTTAGALIGTGVGAAAGAAVGRHNENVSRSQGRDVNVWGNEPSRVENHYYYEDERPYYPPRNPY